MINIKDIRKFGLAITWRLLYLAEKRGIVQCRDIIDYAIEMLEYEESQDTICELAGCYEDEREQIDILLNTLIEKENSKYEIENRKLRVLIVNDVLLQPKDNYIDGLIALTDVWMSLGYPEDSPHIIQGRNNNVQVCDYYTQENYDNLYKANVAWLEKEIQYLKTV